MEVIFIFLVLVVFPLFIYLLVRSILENGRIEKLKEERRILHEKNPSLKYEEAIQRVKRGTHINLFEMNSVDYSIGIEYPISKINRRGGIDVPLKFATPITDKALEIKRKIMCDGNLNLLEKQKLIEYINSQLNVTVRDEADSKARYEADVLLKIESIKLTAKKLQSNNVRRKKMIDKLVGFNSYVELDNKNSLNKQDIQPFVFKSNYWEYKNGDYIIFGGQSYEEGVVNLFKNLLLLKKLSKIQRINALNDPRTI
jgi:hypothetical protein